MDPIIINIPYTITKVYYVNLIPVNGVIYEEDTSWIASWFYGTYDQTADHVAFHIRGNFHNSYGENPHLSLSVFYPDGTNTGILHLERVNGYGVLQHMPGMAFGKKMKRCCIKCNSTYKKLKKPKKPKKPKKSKNPKKSKKPKTTYKKK